jgi:hypothetical protein
MSGSSDNSLNVTVHKQDNPESKLVRGNDFILCQHFEANQASYLGYIVDFFLPN